MLFIFVNRFTAHVFNGFWVSRLLVAFVKRAAGSYRKKFCVTLRQSVVKKYLVLKKTHSKYLNHRVALSFYTEFHRENPMFLKVIFAIRIRGMVVLPLGTAILPLAHADL